MSRSVPSIGEYGHKRIPRDAYFTDEPTIKSLCDNYKLPKRIWEPACGAGNISSHLVDRGHLVFNSDIEFYGYEPHELILDFLEADKVYSGAQAIVTNPPNTHMDEFIGHANALMRPREGVVAILILLQGIATKVRRPVINGPGFSRLIILSRRPRWAEDAEEPKDKKKGPRKSFAWAVWDWGKWNREKRGAAGYGEVVVA